MVKMLLIFKFQIWTIEIIRTSDFYRTRNIVNLLTILISPY